MDEGPETSDPERAGGICGLTHRLRQLGEARPATPLEREAVVDALSRGPSHPTLGQILRRLGSRISSPERTEEILEELWRIGRVGRIPDPRAGTRYDLRTGPHCHFRCRTCGVFRDLRLESCVLHEE